MEKKTNGVRAALRVENRVAVREREDSMMTMRNPTRSGLASARERERERWVDFVARDVDAVWTREGLERRARERTGTNRKRRAVLRARRFASRARVAKRNPSTVSSPLIPARVAMVCRSKPWAGTIRSASSPTWTLRRSRTGSRRARSRRKPWVLCSRRRSSSLKRETLIEFQT